MADITVDDVPDETYTRLAERAAKAGLPLEDFVRRHVIDWARRPDPEVLGVFGQTRSHD